MTVNPDPRYAAVLSSALMARGNNLRLKGALTRLQAGRDITLGIIGGSITEGSAAAAYEECYACLVAEGIRERFGAGGPVHLVNAGVGGTPSPFGLLRWQRDVLDRVPGQDTGALPDIVIIEFAVNDDQDPTGHRCYESLVKTVLSQPNAPAVILLFSVFKDGWNLQEDLKKIGGAYGLMMVSIRDGVMPFMGRIWAEDEWFSDPYHPTSLGHRVMADCVLHAIDVSCHADSSPEDITLDTPPVFGTDFMGIRTILAGDCDLDRFSLKRGSFNSDDTTSYTNRPVGRVCGRNFCHMSGAGNEPLTFTAVFKKLLIGWRTHPAFGTAQVLLDNQTAAVLTCPPGRFDQTFVSLILDQKEAKEHTVAIRMADDCADRQFTITCIGIVP